jgi:hypothetical protein
MTISEQIHKIQTRLNERPDPLLADVLTSLEKLETLSTVDGLLKFHKQEFCSTKKAAEYLGCSDTATRKKVLNYFRPKGRANQIRIPAIALNEGKQKQNYVIVKRGLKALKQKSQS